MLFKTLQNLSEVDSSETYVHLASNEVVILLEFDDEIFFCSSLFQIDGITIRLLDDVPGGPITKFFRFTRNTLDFDFEDESPLGEVYMHLSYALWAFKFRIIFMVAKKRYYSLYQTKEELLRVLGLQEEKGSSLEFLRRSYKVSSLVYYNGLFYICD